MTFKISMLDVGQGEAFILDFPDGSFALIDGGPQAKGTVWANVKARVDAGAEFRWMLVTQWDADHVRGLTRVILDYPPREVVVPSIDLSLLTKLAAKLDPTVKATKTVEKFWTALKASTSIDVSPAHARHKFPDSPGVEGWYLSPSRSVREELADLLEAHKPLSQGKLRELGNRASVVCWFRVFGTTFFMPGEIESDQFGEALVQFDRRRGSRAGENRKANVVKLGHHGSIHNNPVELFQHFVAPSATGLVSAGGRYGHPSPTALSLLRETVGGTPFCTSLGQGCASIISGKRPSDDLSWVEAQTWKDLPNPKTSCHAQVVISVSAAGGLSVVSASTPSSCPFR